MKHMQYSETKLQEEGVLSNKYLAILQIIKD